MRPSLPALAPVKRGHDAASPAGDIQDLDKLGRVCFNGGYSDDHGRSMSEEEGPSAPSVHELSVHDVVNAEIDSDIDRFTADLARIDQQIAELTAQRDGLPPTGVDEEPTDEETHLTSRINTALQRSIQVSQKISQLRHPSEHEARVAKREKTHARITKLRRNNTVAKETAKDQGVPEAYLGENGNFKIGMDARLKSDLVNSVLGLITKDEPGASLQVFSEAEATELLKKRGWTSFLDRKREIVEAQAAKKAAAAAEREERERVRAAEKAEKDAKKAAEKEAKAAEAAAQKAESGASEGKSSSKSGGGLSKTEQARQQREAKAAAAESA